MVKITKRPVKTAVPFPRAINPGVDSVKVNFDDFTLEVRDVETMGKGGKTKCVEVSGEKNVGESLCLWGIEKD